MRADLSYYSSPPVLMACLHAWQQHFAISKNEVLWENLKALVRTDQADIFKAAVDEIQQLAPLPFFEYFTKTWLPDTFVRMWSALHQKNRTLLEMSGTNMLVKA